ncbi:MAG: 50S ribosomal protein L11 [bacterium]|nr:50S ribosomal protein L11 [bacterium]
MAAKKIKAVLKLNIPAGEATPAPPLGPALGQQGVPIMEFVKQYNAATAHLKGQIVPALITVYEDRSFTFVTKVAPMSELIKKKLGIDKGSGKAGKETKAVITKEQLKEIATQKLPDLNTNNIDQAVKMVEGTARSMGIKIAD